MTEYFVLSGTDDADTLLVALGGVFTLVPEKPYEIKRLFLDTFDHALYKKGYLLTREDGRLTLSLPEGDMEASASLPDADVLLRFWRDLPEGPLREELRPVIDIRALLPVVRVEGGVRQFNVINEDEKTVAHVRFEDIRVSCEDAPGGEARLLEAVPVRGYVEEFNALTGYLSSLGLERAQGNIFSLALGAAGRKAGEYSSKTSVRLKPDMPSGEAIKIILRSLLETMRKNEDGIIKDIDTEFLHDYRVAVRRTRSALTLIRGIFPETVKERFKAEFSGIGKKSNELRDLDIYLLRGERYTDMLPPALRPGIGLLFDIITRERKEAHREFVGELASDSYRRSIGSWEDFLNGPAEAGALLPGADSPVIELAKRRIRKRYKKAVKLGKGIDESSSDRELHSLRIECKKLRYYLEFFESLFPADEIKEVIRHLKVLQDNLGDYNDMYVQQERLKGYISKIDPAESEGRESIAAAGGLISELYMRQREIRAEFHERFGEFSGGDMKELFDKLFSDN